MTAPSDRPNHQPAKHLDVPLERVNEALLACSDKDWNYSRISLVARPLATMDSPYVLLIELLDLSTNEGRTDVKTLADEVRWGERHSSELGVLELVSLRINKALLEGTSDEYWQGKRPVARIAEREPLIAQGVTRAFWYEVREVAGDDFENR